MKQGHTSQVGAHMMENAICQYTLSYYHSSIRLKVVFLVNLGMAAAEDSVHGRAVVAAEEEAGVEATMEETG
jgi:hypothetical protein